MYLLIVSTNENIRRELQRWWNETRRTYLRRDILRKLGSRSYIFKLNGATLALLWYLKEKYNGDVQISITENIYEPNIPKEVLDEVKKCINNKIFLSKETLETLRKIKPQYSARLRGN